jgi:hypothetical protein
MVQLPNYKNYPVIKSLIDLIRIIREIRGNDFQKITQLPTYPITKSYCFSRSAFTETVLPASIVTDVTQSL